jgi:hypothetical protein
MIDHDRKELKIIDWASARFAGEDTNRLDDCIDDDDDHCYTRCYKNDDDDVHVHVHVHVDNGDGCDDDDCRKLCLL